MREDDNREPAYPQPALIFGAQNEILGQPLSVKLSVFAILLYLYLAQRDASAVSWKGKGYHPFKTKAA